MADERTLNAFTTGLHGHIDNAQKDAAHQREALHRRMQEVMSQMETAREQLGNFCVTVGEGDNKAVILRAPRRPDAHYVRNPGSLDEQAEEMHDYFFATEDGFRFLAVGTGKDFFTGEDLPLPRSEGFYVNQDAWDTLHRNRRAFPGRLADGTNGKIKGAGYSSTKASDAVLQIGEITGSYRPRI